MASTRERKERFIRSFGPNAACEAVLTLFGRYGLDMLSDELLEEITSSMVDDARATQKRNLSNRRANARRMSMFGMSE